MTIHVYFLSILIVIQPENQFWKYVHDIKKHNIFRRAEKIASKGKRQYLVFPFQFNSIQFYLYSAFYNTEQLYKGPWPKTFAHLE